MGMPRLIHENGIKVRLTFPHHIVDPNAIRQASRIARRHNNAKVTKCLRRGQLKEAAG